MDLGRNVWTGVLRSDGPVARIPEPLESVEVGDTNVTILGLSLQAGKKAGIRGWRSSARR